MPLKNLFNTILDNFEISFTGKYQPAKFTRPCHYYNGLVYRYSVERIIG